MKRSYKQTRRAEARNQTRQRIIEAAIELHQVNGLAATSIGEIAKRAKVGRVTVYRHFPDETALVGACSGEYFARHPLPDIQTWRQIDDADDRLRRGLLDTYRFYRGTEPMLASVLREARDLAIMQPYHEHWRRAADVLAAPYANSTRDITTVRAALHLALAFETWHLLALEHGLSDDQTARLAMQLVSGGREDPGI